MQKQLRASLLFLAFLLPTGTLSAQLIPGGRTVDVGRLRGDFYSEMTSKVKEVLDSWQETWRKVGDSPLPELYFEEATLLQPGGLAIRGRDQLQNFSDVAFPLTSGLRIGMQDLDACEGMAYLSGFYAIDPVTADRAPSTGRHFTVIEQEGKEWLIRTQFFLPDFGAVSFPGLIEPGALDPLTNAQIRSGRKGLSRFAGYGDAEYILLAFRDAWRRGDAADAASFFSPDAWVKLPHEAAGGYDPRSLEERLAEGMARYKNLLSVAIDFDRRDRLSFTLGRYHAEGVDGPDRPGHFLMVLRHFGSGWEIRSLVFS